MAKAKKKISNSKKAIAVGAGVTALAAAAAGAYFFGGKRGAKNRKKVAAWAQKAEKQVMKEVSQMKKATKPLVDKTVDSVMNEYKSLKNIDSKDVAKLAKDLKSQWQAMTKEVKNDSKATVKKVVKVATKAKKSIAKKVNVKTVKKASKKSAKKSSKRK
jgi:hypothetical protein